MHWNKYEVSLSHLPREHKFRRPFWATSSHIRESMKYRDFVLFRETPCHALFPAASGDDRLPWLGASMRGRFMAAPEAGAWAWAVRGWSSTGCMSSPTLAINSSTRKLQRSSLRDRTSAPQTFPLKTASQNHHRGCLPPSGLLSRLASS